MILRIKATNYKMHRKLHVDPNGRSFVLLGDRETGKSTFLEIIEESVGLVPFAPNPLSEGAEAGSMEVTHDWGADGIYTFRRRFTKNGLLRFEVLDGNDRLLKEGMETVVQRIFGRAFFNSYFDYKKYFYECKSTAARYEYVLKSIGGEPVLANKLTIKEKTAKRNQIGGQRITHAGLLSESIIDPDTMEQDIEKYKNEKSIQDIYNDDEYLKLKEQLGDLDNAQEEYELVATANEAVLKIEVRNQFIDLEIVELQGKIKALQQEKKDNAKFIKDNPKDVAYENELLIIAESAADTREVIKRDMEAALERAGTELNQFNRNKNKFDTDMRYLKIYKDLDTQWNKLDTEITDLENENDRLFREQLNIPEISIGEDESIQYLCSDGIKREMCFPNVSKGRSIQITAQIQRVLNPKGNNFIIIPEGQSLGSGLDEIKEECDKFGIQYIVEMTERKQDFQIVFEESQKVGKPESPKEKKVSTVKKNKKA